MFDTERLATVESVTCLLKIPVMSHLNCFRSWSYPHKSSLTNGPRKVRVLRQEAIAWNDRIHIVVLGNLQDAVSVGISCGVGTRQQHGEICVRDVQRGDISPRVYRHGLDTKRFSSPDDPDLDDRATCQQLYDLSAANQSREATYRDFASVGNQQRLDLFHLPSPHYQRYQNVSEMSSRISICSTRDSWLRPRAAVR